MAYYVGMCPDGVCKKGVSGLANAFEAGSILAGMAPTLRLHVFPPANEEGIIPPTSENDSGEFAVEESFRSHFPLSSYASLRYNRPEIVSRIFGDQDDNLDRIDELERELRELYPEADVLRVRDDSGQDDQEGPEWEYDGDIIIRVANLGIDSPQIRWQHGEDLYGEQLTPPGASASEQIALTDGRNLRGVNIDSGEVTWSVTIPERTRRSPILVGQAVITETEGGHIAYGIESGEKRWTVDNPAAGIATTRHMCLNRYCYYGDSEGTLWELSSTGNYRAICELEERIIAVYPTEEQVYALMIAEGKSGLTPETLHAVNRTSGDEQWVFAPEESLKREFAAGLEFVFVSTRKEMFALHPESGDVVWSKPLTESSTNKRADANSGDKNTSSQDDETKIADESNGTDSINSPDWRAFDSDNTSRSTLSASADQSKSIHFTTQPITDEKLFAPTNNGLLQIEPSTGDVSWKALTRDNKQNQFRFGFPVGQCSPPTHTEDYICIGAGDSVYAIHKESGKQEWEFETPGNPGTMTFDSETGSLTFVTQGLAINISVDDTK